MDQITHRRALQMGIWLPVYGGWLGTRDQSKGPDIAACLAIAQQAEALGYDFLYASENLLNCVHGPKVAVVDAWSLISALSATTTRIGLCGAIKPGFRSPLLVARMLDTLTQIAGRPLAINIVCGWWRDEFELANVDWLDHAGRYDRADAFLRTLNRLFEPDMERTLQRTFLDHAAFDDSRAQHASTSSLDGDPLPSLRSLRSLPAETVRTFGFRPETQPEIWVSGHSPRATQITGEWGDCLFLNGTPDRQLERHIIQARQAAANWGREIKIALNAFVIATESADQALERRDKVLQRRNDETIAFFRNVMEASGAAAWTDLTDLQMVDSNSGFDAQLIGSFSDVRSRLATLSELGVDKIVCQFDDPMRDVGPFMQHVIRPLRETHAKARI